MFDDPFSLPPDGSPAAPAPAEPAGSPAVERFRSCRWRAQANGEPLPHDHCTHRDVLPFAGREGFNAEAWCPDCSYYKLRRTPRKREY
jgi:hypothetical protein